MKHEYWFASTVSNLSKVTYLLRNLKHKENNFCNADWLTKNYLTEKFESYSRNSTWGIHGGFEQKQLIRRVEPHEIVKLLLEGKVTNEQIKS